MAVNTILLDLSVEISKIIEKKTLTSTIKEVLSKFIPELKEAYSNDFKGGGFLNTYTAVRDSFVSVRGFPKGLVSINLEYYKEDGDEPILTFEKGRSLEAQLRFAVSAARSKIFPAVRRGARFDVYLNSSDERILEYDIDALLFEEQSPYQRVQIVHSRTLGNLLVLDELQNMSEKDLIYTETLMQRGKEDYSGKEIVILGGGDGGLLYELLKENPKFVTMLELDEVVLRACRSHLRGCCGDCLDKLEGANYKIIVDDCVKSLDAMIAEGKKVDYVFGDLTDIPVSPTPQGEIWDFIRLIINKTMQVLKPTGKYLTHGNGVASPAALAMFENELRNLNVPVEFSTDRAFIPSFLEEWAFYQVWFKQVN